MAIFSPSTVGKVATRMSSNRPAAAALSEMRPSCGWRSAMSSPRWPWSRMTPAVIRFGTRCTSSMTPSVRNLTTSESACGSKWTSEQPSSAAWKKIEDEPDERVGDPVLGFEVVARLVVFGGGQLLFGLEHGARAECFSQRAQAA